MVPLLVRVQTTYKDTRIRLFHHTGMHACTDACAHTREFARPQQLQNCASTAELFLSKVSFGEPHH